MVGLATESATIFLEKCGQKFRIGTSFFLNITTVIDNIIIKKGINYHLVTGKVLPKACITFIHGA